MASPMNDFISNMFEEMAARRRRLRESFGDRGQSLVEFLVFGGIVTGSLGLLIGPWMVSAAPWGFAIPPVFLAGYMLIERWRQRQVANEAPVLSPADQEAEEDALRRMLREARADDPSFSDEDRRALEERFRVSALERRRLRVGVRTDWAALLWGLACAIAGVAAFVIAWGARPAPPPAVDDEWRPPASAVDSDMTAPPQ